MIGAAPNEEAASVGGLNQELSRTLKNFTGGRPSPELKNWAIGSGWQGAAGHFESVNWRPHFTL
jgi:hypothetical protein